MSNIRPMFEILEARTLLSVDLSYAINVGDGVISDEARQYLENYKPTPNTTPGWSGLTNSVTTAGDGILNAIDLSGGFYIGPPPLLSAEAHQALMDNLANYARDPASVRDHTDSHNTTPGWYGLTNSIITAADSILNVDELRLATGATDAGIKIAVISDRVDGLAQVQGDDELPQITIGPGMAGSPERALLNSAILQPREAFRLNINYFSHALHAPASQAQMAGIKPTSPAFMHGSAGLGNTGELLPSLTDIIDAVPLERAV